MNCKHNWKELRKRLWWCRECGTIKKVFIDPTYWESHEKPNNLKELEYEKTMDR